MSGHEEANVAGVEHSLVQYSSVLHSLAKQELAFLDPSGASSLGRSKPIDGQLLLGEQSSLPQDVVTSLIALIKDEHTHAQSYATEILGKRSTLPYEVVGLLILLLKDKNRHLQHCAMEALGSQLSLPQEAITSLLVLIEKSGLGRDAAQLLGKQSTLPYEAIAVLIVLLEDEDSSVRCSAITVLEGHLSSLPQEGVTALATAFLEDGTLFVRYFAAESLKNYLPSPPQEDIVHLITLLEKTRDSFIYDLLHKCKFYPSIKDLDDQTWQKLWSYWHRNSHDE